MKANDGAVFVGLNYAEFAGLQLINGDRGDCYLCSLVDMELDHFADIHAINVIGAEYHYQMRRGLFNQVDVLENGVGGAPVPVLAWCAHLRRNWNNKMIPQQAGRFPTLPKVLQERLALELHQNVNRVDTGVDQIAEDKINNAVPAAERDRGLGTFFGQRV